MLRRPLLFALALACATAATTALAADETKDQKIARALTAGPPSVTAKATIADTDPKGKMSVLRKGTNGWTCMPGHPGVIGDDPICADAMTMQWMDDWAAHKAKPANKKPGIAYMFAGGTDWSASDPFATKGTSIKEPPHYMVMWPFDAKTSGFPTTARDTGTWIMYAGTPYAHLMVNGKT